MESWTMRDDELLKKSLVNMGFVESKRAPLSGMSPQEYPWDPAKTQTYELDVSELSILRRVLYPDWVPGNYGYEFLKRFLREECSVDLAGIRQFTIRDSIDMLNDYIDNRLPERKKKMT